jgi:hypothetical protein
LTVLDSFLNYGWENSTALPAGKWAHALVFSKLCAHGDTSMLYAIGGNDASFANTTSVLRQNMTTGNWTTVAPMPATRNQFSAVELDGKIYVPGGYLSSFNPQNTLYIYDPVTNSWSTGATMPTAVGDYGIGTYADSLIYVTCGYAGSGDVSQVQIYNIRTNTWLSGTPFAGSANAGGRMGISGNKIVYAGGYSQSAGQPSSTAWIGEIDPADPTVIAWTAIPGGLPIGGISRFAAGSGFGNGRVYFTGGDPAGDGNSVNNRTIAYNTLTSVW